ncbi:hypothetical protein L2E82_37612 [Cichorium intybus]|uniref:Uncharacterized protein n=1 Tax=Cichorium intybus TaxID=13427 RepID=A0ACB9AFE7_CICIN|nr:hypothetical protein L2E82_37612 [Cichorium intybus]
MWRTVFFLVFFRFLFDLTCGFLLCTSEEETKEGEEICINERLKDDELRQVLVKLETDKGKEVFCLVCKKLLYLQSTERNKLCARAGPHMLRKMAAIFTRLKDLDFSQSASRSFYSGVTDSDLSVIATGFTALHLLKLQNCKAESARGLIVVIVMLLLWFSNSEGQFVLLCYLIQHNLLISGAFMISGANPRFAYFQARSSEDLNPGEGVGGHRGWGGMMARDRRGLGRGSNRKWMKCVDGCLDSKHKTSTKEMKDQSSGLIIGISIGVVIGALLAISGLLWLMVLILVPTYQTYQWAQKQNHQVIKMKNICTDRHPNLQKATYNFTSLIGQGAFGPVYKAQMTAGEAVAVKEFQTEVMLLGRLHHRNLVNLVGYCAEKGQHMLIYVYMSIGSLASHLYSKSSSIIL